MISRPCGGSNNITVATKLSLNYNQKSTFQSSDVDLEDIHISTVVSETLFFLSLAASGVRRIPEGKTRVFQD